jgi:hypothetical protein
VTSVKNTIKCFKHWQAAQRRRKESESEMTILCWKLSYWNVKNVWQSFVTLFIIFLMADVYKFYNGRPSSWKLLISRQHYTKQADTVVISIHLYSRAALFESWLQHQLSWLQFSCVSSVPHAKCWDSTVNRLQPLPSKLSIILLSDAVSFQYSRRHKINHKNKETKLRSSGSLGRLHSSPL